MKETKILITGGTGFIGSHLMKRLLKKGYDVHLIIRETSNLILIEEDIQNIRIHRYNGEIESLVKIMMNVKPDAVFHLASLYLTEHKMEEIDSLIKSNILFGTQLLEAMKESQTDKLINVGTSWQHYNNEEYNPVNLYAATKEAFEKIINYYVETTSIRTITLKLFDTYGANDPRRKLISLLMEAATSGERLSMSPGDQLIDIVYIDDVIDAFEWAYLLLKNDILLKNSNYGISSNNPIKLKEVVDVIEKVLDKELSIDWGGRPYRKREVMIPWKPSEPLPGWKPKVDIENGIELLLKHYN